ncbi:gamma-glutamyl-gamma-aminobutyrate hydrolase family protein [Candidatus Pelagibacter ubique]|nr:gamma-glutamyl-gamma-aminobutyrate hydrolase family protein [Candidatus Pelagibacter ubique]
MKKKIFISPILNLNKYNELEYSFGENWNSLFKNNYSLFTFFSTNHQFILEHLLNCNGLIIQGTGDISLINSNKLNKIRDKFEKKIIKIGIKKKIPILCVCRGFQLFNNTFKGSLIKTSKHVGTEHKIFFKKNPYFKKKNITVNSFHNYNIKKLSNILRPIAHSEDGNVEIAYGKKYKILCTMFHPERDFAEKNFMNKILLKFFL